MSGVKQQVIFSTVDGKLSVHTQFDEETAWLSLDQMAALFDRDKSTISRHIKNVFDEGELERKAVVANFATTASDGKTYQVEHFNLDVIISVGYRVKSLRATQFRIWATNILKEYLKKGFALNDDRLKNLGGGNAIDYDPKSEDSLAFFKMVQNKLHYAAHGKTASEVIYLRVDSDKPFAGLTKPTQAEAMSQWLFHDLIETILQILGAASQKLISSLSYSHLLEYATANEKVRLFVSKYKLSLPSEDTLKTFLEKELQQVGIV